MMTLKLIVVLFFLFQFLALETSAQSDVESTCSAIRIDLTGGNQAIPYNSNENVTFSCQIEGGLQVIWQVLRIQYRHDRAVDVTGLFNMYGIIIEVDDPSLNSSQIIITERTRQITSLPELEVVCLPSIFCKSLPTETRSVFTYGPLAAPQGLRLTAQSSNTFNFSWIKPDVPPGVQLTSFIEVMNLTSMEFNVFSTTEESIIFEFTGFGEAQCSEFNITVYSSDNVSVNSELGFIIENIPISPDVTPIKVTLNTTVDMGDGISIIVSFCPATVCSQNYPVLNYTVSLLTDNSTFPVDLIPSSTSLSCNPPVSLTVDTSDVPQLAVDQEYNITVTACSNITCRTTDSVTTYTTGVQNATIYYINRTLLLACDFAANSRASGCLFNFTSTSIEDGETVEMFNLTQSLSRVNSTVCGASRTCLCVMTNNLPTSYSSIRGYTVENEDGLLSGISLPVTLNNTQSNEEIVRECIQLFAQPVVAGGLSPGGAAGIAVSFIIVFIIAGGVGFILIWKLCLYYKDKKQYELFMEESEREKKKLDRELAELREEVRYAGEHERHLLGVSKTVLVVFLNNSSTSELGDRELDKKLKEYEESSEASPLKSNLGKVLYIKDLTAVTELTNLIDERIE